MFRKLLLVLAIVFSVAVFEGGLVYLTATFITMEWDPLLWEQEYRGNLTIAFWAIFFNSLVLMFAVYYSSED